MQQAELPFWKRKPLSELDHEEWESLCDGCTKCCVYRLEDEDTQVIYYTNVHCRQLDTSCGRCRNYAERSVLVPDCVTITPAVLEDTSWLPPTCAYRLLAEGRDLPDWHPLVSGNPDSVQQAGQRYCDRTISEDEAGPLEQHLVDWID
jgi:uncharacterized cysteine cluster protein YcgN (CxxCxxCC family)